MKEKLTKALKHPIKKIYFTSVFAVYLLITLTSFSFSFYNFLAYGQEVKEVNLYKKYVLTYDNQGGSGCTNQVQYKGQAWGTLCTPTKTGYIFLGWYTDTEGDGTKITSDTTASQTLTVHAIYYENTLYDILRVATIERTYAKKYTGNHQDSMNSSLSTEKIYHWYGTTDANGTAILDKNNVIFANHCWQMIRTTDTGGVRMIYNGEVVDGKCLNTRGTHVGYNGKTSQSINGTYWYGTEYTYSSGAFSLAGTISLTEVTNNNGSTVIPTLVGKYTCKSTTESGTCSTLYYIESHDSNSYANVIVLNSSSNYSQFGILQFNATNNVGYAYGPAYPYDSPAYVGYMYNVIYPTMQDETENEKVYQGVSMSTSYYYADSYDYNGINPNKYTLTNPYQVTSTSDYPSLVGKYTFSNTSSTYSSTEIFYIVKVSNTAAYGIKLSNGHDWLYYNDTYTYGDSYTDNGNGTYTINNPATINRVDYYENNNDLASKYVCKNATNNTCSDLWHTIDTTITNFYYYKSSNLYKYAKGFTYNNNTGEYTLNNDSVTFWDRLDESDITSLSMHHYTCFNETGVCSTLAYAFYYDPLGKLNYINLTGGKGIEDALEEMLYSNNVNTRDSIMKLGIELWYKKYLLSYDSYIDDTIYCNDRSIIALGGFNPNGGSVLGTDSRLQFKEYNAGSDLSCTNITDKFSTSNSSAQLSYKVGLMSAPEMNLLNQNKSRRTGQAYWIFSPKHFSNKYAIGYSMNASGALSPEYTSSVGGVRPTISLIQGVRYSSGDGTMANPYVVDLTS